MLVADAKDGARFIFVCRSYMSINSNPCSKSVSPSDAGHGCQTLNVDGTEQDRKDEGEFCTLPIPSPTVPD